MRDNLHQALAVAACFGVVVVVGVGVPWLAWIDPLAIKTVVSPTHPPDPTPGAPPTSPEEARAALADYIRHNPGWFRHTTADDFAVMPLEHQGNGVYRCGIAEINTRSHTFSLESGWYYSCTGTLTYANGGLVVNLKSEKATRIR